MIKKITILAVALIAFIALGSCSTTSGSGSEQTTFKGEYQITLSYENGEVADMFLFVIKANGEIAGQINDMNVTAFTGNVNSDGTFECQILSNAVGGGFSGTIDKDGNLTGTANMHGLNADLEGNKL